MGSNPLSGALNRARLLTTDRQVYLYTLHPAEGRTNPPWGAPEPPTFRTPTVRRRLPMARRPVTGYIIV
jgi:hypothetical protein